MLFDDDDDMLGNMGLDGRKSTLLPSDSPPETGARSVLNNLLQGGSKTEKKSSQLEKSSDFMSSSFKMPGLSISSLLVY